VTRRARVGILALSALSGATMPAIGPMIRARWSRLSWDPRCSILPCRSSRWSMRPFLLLCPSRSQCWLVTSIRPQVVRFTAALADPHGSSTSIGWFNAPGQIWVSPTRRKPAVGTLQAHTFEQLTSSFAAARVPYVYSLDIKATAGIIPVPHYRIKPSSLATVTDRYYQDRPSTGSFYLFHRRVPE
jgi:hypothetical protein